jgi:hypothetical protein
MGQGLNSVHATRQKEIMKVMMKVIMGVIHYVGDYGG